MVKPALTASLVVATLAALANSPTPASGRIEVAELTVESVQEGLRSHRFTARQLAEASYRTRPNRAVMPRQWINKIAMRGEQLTRLLVPHYLQAI